jgi:hypothetical protein
MKLITRTVLFACLCSNSLLAQTNSSKLFFRENKGQVSDQNYQVRPDVLFSGSDAGFNFHLKNNGISYQLSKVLAWTKKETNSARAHSADQLVPSKISMYRLDVNWLNASATPHIEKGKALPGYENFYSETCPNGALDVKSYSELTYQNIYAGIDLKWYEKNGSLEYDYYVAANTDHSVIQLQYEGARSISIDRNGDLLIKTPLGTLREHRPIVMQGNQQLTANWKISNTIVSFEIKNRNMSLPIIIDPSVRLWSTYYGGSSDEDGYFIYSNSIGEVYVTGATMSTLNMATVGAYQTIFGGGTVRGDGYIAKFDPSGQRLWATYYGGSATDYFMESITNSTGDVFVVGGTATTNTAVIATPGVHQTSLGSGTVVSTDAMLVKI